MTLEEDDALVDALTPRERFLIEEAWRAGANTARKQLTQALLRAVHETIGKWRFEPRVFQPPKWDRTDEHYDPRVIDIVRRADNENLKG